MPKSDFCTKSFLDAKGETQERANAQTAAVVFSFANGKKHSVALADFPKPIAHQLFVYGVTQKLGDTYAAKKGTPDEDRIDKFEGVLENLLDGEWVMKGEGTGEPRGLLFEALLRHNAKAKGRDLTDEERATISGKVKEMTPEQRKQYSANATIALIIQDIREERAKAKKKELAAAAKDQKVPDELTLV